MKRKLYLRTKEKLAHVKAWKDSGLSQKEYGAAVGILQTQISTWSRGLNLDDSMAKTVRERFDEKTELNTETGCLEWTGYKSKKGYGSFGPNRKMLWAHRYAYEQIYGSIPNGLEIRHLCHNRACVNVDHLTIGTHQENMADMVKANRQPTGERVHLSKLCEKDIIEIRALYRVGLWNQEEIGVIYDVDGSQVSRIVRRKTWKHVK